MNTEYENGSNNASGGSPAAGPTTTEDRPAHDDRLEHPLRNRRPHAGHAHGGIGAIHLLVRKLGLDKAINERLGLLKIHLPYHDSDHVFNIAYNLLAGGTCLEHLELRRRDEAYLNALGARRVPDPTTAGDFCRRYEKPQSAVCKNSSMWSA